MRLLIVSDVHGCYHTYAALLEKYWDRSDTLLIQLGDLINKGPHSAQCLKLSWELQNKYPHLCYFLRGNHEQMLLHSLQKYGRPQGMEELRLDLAKHKISTATLTIWLESLSLFWENPSIYVSHAGISLNEIAPLDVRRPDSILNNRKALRNIGKTQIVGHVVQPSGKAVFSSKENAWHIDTGSCLGKGLTALLINYDGSAAKTITEATHKADMV